MSEFIGRKISLISKAGIRYEGVLYTIDPAESTVALSKVKSFGTEERVVERAIGPREEVYEFIIFRASDIQDLVVCEVGREASLLSEDSAIVRAAETSTEERAGECWDWLQAGRPPVARSGVSLGHQYTHAGPARDSANERSVWGPTSSSSVMPGAGGSNNTSGGGAGTSNHHAHLHGHHNKSQAVASSGDGGNAGGPRRDAPPSSLSVAPPAAATAAGQQARPGHFQTTAQTQANQRLKAEARSRLMKPPRNSARDNCGDYDGMNYRGSSQRDYYYYYSQPSHSKQGSRYNNNSNQYYNRRDNHNYSNQHQQYYNYYSYPSGYSANTSSNTAAAAGGASAANAAAAATNNTGTSGSDSSGKLRGFECSAVPGAAADQSNLSSNGPYHNQNQQQRHRGAASNHTGKSSQSAGAGALNNTSHTTAANGNSHSNSGPTGAGSGAGKHKKKPARNDPADSDKKEGFKDDYDFETANAMIAQELANLHVSQDNNKRDVGNNASNGAREDGHLSDHSDGGYYDKTKSFFDKISSEMTDRAKGKTVRPMNRKEERKINVETFGVADANRSHGRNASKWNRNSRYYAKSNRGSNQSGTNFRGNAHANDSFKKDFPYKASRGYMSGGRRPILVDGPGRGDDY